MDRSTGITASIRAPLAGDTVQVAVIVTIVGWRDGKEASFDAWFEVSHVNGSVVRVAYPDGWRAILRQIGIDDEDIDAEGYMSMLAKLEFARQRRHMTCAKCEVPRAAAAPECAKGELHDWTVAR